MKRFAQLLREIREASGMTPHAWCRARGVSFIQWKRLESGQWTPRRMATLLKYAAAVARNPGEARSIVLAAQHDQILGNAGLGLTPARFARLEIRGIHYKFPLDPEKALLDTLLRRIGAIPGGECEIPLGRKV